jgi:cellulose synthase/poly-beta-1,6-N-acetylglucosamine synthase-like glycosyltransferase
LPFILSKYNLNHLNILIAVLWLCCANIVVVDDFSLESDDSLSSLSDSSGDDEDRVRPKNENYFEETIPQYNEQEFMEHFRVSRQVANSIAERFEMRNAMESYRLFNKLKFFYGLPGIRLQVLEMLQIDSTLQLAVYTELFDVSHIF